MPAVDLLTYDIAVADGGAVRPSVNHVGGAVMEDKAGSKAPATDGRQVYAGMMNQIMKQIAALARTAAPVKMTVDFSAGTPFIDKLATLGTLLVATPGVDFTLVDLGAGDTQIEYMTLKLPPFAVDHQATVNAAGGDWTISVFRDVSGATSRIRVVTKNAGVATDARFTLTIN